MAVVMCFMVLWFVAPYNVVYGYQMIGGNSRHLLNAIRVKKGMSRNGKSKWRKFGVV
jgi:hypothetical protein